MNRSLQTQFAAALFDSNQSSPNIIKPAHSTRFRVYQNNVIAGLTESLIASFPALTCLLGEAYFLAVIREFVVLHPPRSPIMAQYGAELPDFLDTFAPLANMPYLGDVARIELARIESFHSAELPSVGVSKFNTFNAEQLSSARFELHPSIKLVISDHPIYQLWHSQLRNGKLPEVEDWRGEEVICARQNRFVSTQRLQSGGATFFSALNNDFTLAGAWAAACEVNNEFNLIEALGLMIHDQLTVRVIL